jgi:hypothetical protein
MESQADHRSKTVYACLGKGVGSQQCPAKGEKQKHCVQGVQSQVGLTIGRADVMLSDSVGSWRCSCTLGCVQTMLRAAVGPLNSAGGPTVPQRQQQQPSASPWLCYTAVCCRCCAERNLLNEWVTKARRQNVPKHQVVHWVRRKAGADLTVWRHLSDGTLAISVPCLRCKVFLDTFDIRVTCLVGPNEWFSGRLSDEDAPVAKLTTGQRRQLPAGRAEWAAALQVAVGSS